MNSKTKCNYNFSFLVFIYKFHFCEQLSKFFHSEGFWVFGVLKAEFLEFGFLK
jgi:hypothetical protein